MRHQHRQTQHSTDCSREPSEPGQDLTFKGGSRAGAALVIPTNPSTPGGARRQQLPQGTKAGLVNQQHPGGQIQVGKAQTPHLHSHCSQLFSPRLIVSGGLRAAGTCNAACRASYCFAPHSKQPRCLSKRFLQAVSSLPPTTANCFNAAFKAAGLHFRAHTCALHSPLYWSPQAYPGSFRSLMSWLILVCLPSKQQQEQSQGSLSTALTGWWSRECWGTSHKSPVNPQNPHAHSKTAFISLNSHQQKYSFPLQVTKGTVVLPSSPSQQQGLCFALGHAKICIHNHTNKSISLTGTWIQASTPVPATKVLHKKYIKHQYTLFPPLKSLKCLGKPSIL